MTFVHNEKREPNNIDENIIFQIHGRINVISLNIFSLLRELKPMFLI